MSVVETPHMRALAEEGALFEHACTPSPLCLPARSAFHSGRHVHESRCYNNCNVNLPGRLTSFGSILGQHGVHTVHMGKADLWRPVGELGYSEVVRPGDRRPPGDRECRRNPLAIRSGARERADGYGERPDAFKGPGTGRRQRRRLAPGHGPDPGPALGPVRQRGAPSLPSRGDTRAVGQIRRLRRPAPPRSGAPDGPASAGGRPAGPLPDRRVQRGPDEGSPAGLPRVRGLGRPAARPTEGRGRGRRSPGDDEPGLLLGPRGDARPLRHVVEVLALRGLGAGAAARVGAGLRRAGPREHPGEPDRPAGEPLRQRRGPHARRPARPAAAGGPRPRRHPPRLQRVPTATAPGPAAS